MPSNTRRRHTGAEDEARLLLMAWAAWRDVITDTRRRRRLMQAADTRYFFRNVSGPFRAWVHLYQRQQMQSVQAGQLCERRERVLVHRTYLQLKSYADARRRKRAFVERLQSLRRRKLLSEGLRTAVSWSRHRRAMKQRTVIAISQRSRQLLKTAMLGWCLWLARRHERTRLTHMAQPRIMLVRGFKTLQCRTRRRSECRHMMRVAALAHVHILLASALKRFKLLRPRRLRGQRYLNAASNQRACLLQHRFLRRLHRRLSANGMLQTADIERRRLALRTVMMRLHRRACRTALLRQFPLRRYWERWRGALLAYRTYEDERVSAAARCLQLSVAMRRWEHRVYEARDQRDRLTQAFTVLIHRTARGLLRRAFTALCWWRSLMVRYAALGGERRHRELSSSFRAWAVHLGMRLHYRQITVAILHRRATALRMSALSSWRAYVLLCRRAHAGMMLRRRHALLRGMRKLMTHAQERTLRRHQRVMSVEHYLLRLQRAAFAALTAAVESRNQVFDRRKASIHHAAQRLMRTAVKAWAAAMPVYRRKHLMARQADAFWRLLWLERWKRLWTRRCTDRHKVVAGLANSGRHAVRRVFTSWRALTQECMDINRSREVGVRLMEQGADMRLLGAVWHKWAHQWIAYRRVRRSRKHRADQHRKHQLMKSCVREWRAYSDRKAAKRRRQTSATDQIDRGRCMLVFNAWNEVMLRRYEARFRKCTALQHWARTLSCRAFRAWHAYHLHRQQTDTDRAVAKQIFTQRLQRDAVHMMLTAYDRQQQADLGRQCAVHQQRSAREVRLAQWVAHRWRAFVLARRSRWGVEEPHRGGILRKMPPPPPAAAAAAASVRRSPDHPSPTAIPFPVRHHYRSPPRLPVSLSKASAMLDELTGQQQTRRRAEDVSSRRAAMVAISSRPPPPPSPSPSPSPQPTSGYASRLYVRRDRPSPARGGYGASSVGGGPLARTDGLSDVPSPPSPPQLIPRRQLDTYTHQHQQPSTHTRSRPPPRIPTDILTPRGGQKDRGPISVARYPPLLSPPRADRPPDLRPRPSDRVLQLRGSAAPPARDAAAVAVDARGESRDSSPAVQPVRLGKESNITTPAPPTDRRDREEERGSLVAATGGLTDEMTGHQGEKEGSDCVGKEGGEAEGGGGGE
ncbi:unnamed protein product [Vitrella brassicaformis CCMP3155]|uniref:Sfi1 spindle body domain-containing protein n=2 Tax=Vitrella brassicaformis TaxID=1169539 RepID=A0A0G4FW39_VITBC|nr:unnamed protein product [Vitrella brassicaformis CCMP3155]|eukprot:CEM19323.1 unnamed protein product [Vitrella brassicaformis CCMP3155]